MSEPIGWGAVQPAVGGALTGGGGGGGASTPRAQTDLCPSLSLQILGLK